MHPSPKVRNLGLMLGLLVGGIWLGVWIGSVDLGADGTTPSAFRESERQTNACEAARWEVYRQVVQRAPLYNQKQGRCEVVKFHSNSRTAQVFVVSSANRFEIILDGSGPLWRVANFQEL